MNSLIQVKLLEHFPVNSTDSEMLAVIIMWDNYYVFFNLELTGG